MSLDITLLGEPATKKCICPGCGNEHDIEGGEELHWQNITHNLGAMADEAGIYEHLWRPEKVGVTHARQLIEPLRIGIALMKDDPERFKLFNANNGWGTYNQFVPWLEKLLEACEQYSDAKVEVGR